MTQKEKAAQVLEVLKNLYPVMPYHLKHDGPWQLLVATVLSAQCTDARVNQVTPGLFRRYPSVQDMSIAEQGELEEIIRSTGFYRNKARHIIAAARKLVRDFDGVVPSNMPELLRLDGVARKTANVVLWEAFRINEGLAVDTHVARISERLGLCNKGSPEQIEKKLCSLFPQEEWGGVNHRMVSFGRDVCKARSPGCEGCPLAYLCPAMILKK